MSVDDYDILSILNYLECIHNTYHKIKSSIE